MLKFSRNTLQSVRVSVATLIFGSVAFCREEQLDRVPAGTNRTENKEEEEKEQKGCPHSTVMFTL